MKSRNRRRKNHQSGAGDKKRGGKLRQRSSIKVAATLLLSSLPVGAAFTQDRATFTPAKLGEGEQSLLARLRTPLERPTGNYDVPLTCQVIVEPDGSTRSPRCLAIERYMYNRLIRSYVGSNQVGGLHGRRIRGSQGCGGAGRLRFSRSRCDLYPRK